VNVYVGFSRGTSWIARAIQWFTRGKESHAFLLYWSADYGTWMNVGSELGGWICQVQDAPGETCALYSMPVDLSDALRKHRDWLGASYDVGGLLGMAFVMVAWNWFKQRMRNPFNAKGAWFCSEIVSKILRDAGLPLALPPGQTDPHRLRLEVEACGGRLIKWEEKIP
jgi:hypothetical protein